RRVRRPADGPLPRRAPPAARQRGDALGARPRRLRPARRHRHRLPGAALLPQRGRGREAGAALPRAGRAPGRGSRSGGRDITPPPAAVPMANRLADTQSPYLLQHAENPVDWYPWGDEAFAEA